jgi:hypothetical protein
MGNTSNNSKYSKAHPLYYGTIVVKTRNGWVEIDRIRYDHDVIIHTDRHVTKRSKKEAKKFKKKYGHTPLIAEELEDIVLENPVLVYIGTGQYGDLPVAPEAREILGNYLSVIRPTPEILDLIAGETRPFVAILHVNC